MHFETATKPLRELVRGFSCGTILLPQFQRDYIWKPPKIRNLLDSLLNGYPVGGFYVWRPMTGEKDPKRKAYGDQHIPAEFEGYLIDGQQRLTSLEAAFGLYSGEDKRGDELRCYLDLEPSDVERRRETRLFVTYAGNKSVARRVENGDSTLIPLSQLIAGLDYELRRKTEETLRAKSDWDTKRIGAALTRLDKACRMLDQLVPCTTVHDATDEEAVDVFSRLNKGGTALKQGDVRAAELARGDAVEVLKSMREFVIGEVPQRLGFGFSFAFRALVLFHRQSAQFTTLKPDWMTIPGPHRRTLADSWCTTERALSRTLDFVDHHMGWSRRTLLPSANAVIVLAAAFDKDENRLSAKAKESYRRWLCLTALRGVFQGSVETTINRFYRAIRDCRRDPAKALVKALRRREAGRVRRDELDKNAQPWGAATQVIHAWLVSRGAKDWLTGDSIDSLVRSGSLSPTAGDLTVHHVSPRGLRGWLRRQLPGQLRTTEPADKRGVRQQAARRGLDHAVPRSTPTG